MNTEILNQYTITFHNANGIAYAEAENFNLGVFISTLRNKRSAEHLLRDINLALDNRCDQIFDATQGIALGADVYFGVINDDLTFSVYYEHDPMKSVDYPLNDIKEIFMCWVEFIS